MVAQWFYPKDLKDLIAKLEAEDNLRREPIQRFNRVLWFMFFLVILGALIILSSDGAVLAFVWILMGIFVIWMSREARFHEFKQYLIGSVHEGVIKKISYHPFQSTTITCVHSDNNASIKLQRLEGTLSAKHGVEVGNTIKFYEHPSVKAKPMPDIYIVKRFYCLRKDLMNEA